MSIDPTIRYLLSLAAFLWLVFIALILQTTVGAWWMAPLWIAVGWRMERVWSGSAPYSRGHVEDQG